MKRGKPRFLSQPSTWVHRAKPARGPWHARFLHSLEGHQERAADGFWGFFGNRKAVLLLTLLIIVPLGILAIDQGLKTPGQPSPLLHRDPINQIIYGDNLPTNDLSQYNTFLASFNSAPGINASPNATHASVAITKNSYDLSLVATKHLIWQFNLWLGSYPASGSDFAVYLTRNSTVPKTPDYNPIFDKNVAVELLISGISTSPVVTTYILVQHDPTQSIFDEGGLTNCPSATGTCFASANTNVCFGTPPTGVPNTYVATFNYTGSQATGGNNGRSTWIISNFSGGSCNVNGVQTSIFLLPWLQISTQPYFTGFWQKKSTNGGGLVWNFKGTNCNNQATSFDCNQALTVQTITPATPPAQPPQLDTGGFFGPIIKALIGLGTFILTGTASFFGAVYIAFRDMLDTVGNFLGVGAIGTNIANALAGFSTWITSIFSTTFNNIGQAVQTLINGMNAVINLLGGYFTFLQNGFNALKDLFSFVWTVIGQVVQYSVLGYKWFVVATLALGIVSALEGMPQFNNWVRFNFMVFSWGYKFMDWLFDNVVEKIILRFKRIVAQWL